MGPKYSGQCPETEEEGTQKEWPDGAGGRDGRFEATSRERHVP